MLSIALRAPQRLDQYFAQEVPAEVPDEVPESTRARLSLQSTGSHVLPSSQPSTNNALSRVKLSARTSRLTSAERRNTEDIENQIQRLSEQLDKEWAK
jgi:hypothetical protein